MNLGAHLTIAKGIPAAFAMADRVGATNFQFFPRNPRGGARRVIENSEILAGHEARATSGVRTVVGHVPYTVNLATNVSATRAFATTVLREDLELCSAMGADILVVHPGFHRGDGLSAGIARIAEVVMAVLDNYDGVTKIAFEAMAGGGTSIGGGPDELASIMKACSWHPKLGTCIDSCHVFAAGWDVRTPDGVHTMVSAFGDAVGFDNILCVHLNDSAMDLGSHKDRHARIGKGKIGPEGIKALITDPLLSGLPLILETPVDDPLQYADEIAAVKSLI